MHAGRAFAAAVALLAVIAPAAGASSSHRGVLPPADPSQSLPIPGDLITYSCEGSGVSTCSGVCVTRAVPVLNEDPACTRAALAAIDAGRARESLPSMRLPSDWARLTVDEQLFVTADLERVARGLLPYVGLVTSLDRAAATAAARAEDPSVPMSGLRAEWGNWSEGSASPLIADYAWMYADGPGGENLDCPSAHAAGCWGHRNNILGAYALRSADCYMGAGFDAAYGRSGPSFTELFVEPAGAALRPIFTWAADVAPFLPASERS